jgi:hypothetical protein
MSELLMPRYPIYVLSKGRVEKSLTADFLIADSVPFRLVVEPQEADAYIAKFGVDKVLALPCTGEGSATPARNWIKAHSIAEGHARHWQLDDNIKMLKRMYKGKRIVCRSGVAFAVTEDFTDRYENIAIAGLNYVNFAPRTARPMPPFFLNCHVYSCVLIDNALPFKWRPFYNDDTDMCLQVLAAGYCTLAMNVFLAHKMATGSMRGGSAPIYKDDGRLKMARSLERDWPHVVQVHRRFSRAQHVIRGNWAGFDTKLKRKPEFADIPDEINDYGMRFVEGDNYRAAAKKAARV